MVSEANDQNDGLLLDEKNFRNLVFFYIKELGLLQRGVEVTDILSKTERAMLKDRGIIDYSFKETWLTKKALKVLKELE